VPLTPSLKTRFSGFVVESSKATSTPLGSRSEMVMSGIGWALAGSASAWMLTIWPAVPAKG